MKFFITLFALIASLFAIEPLVTPQWLNKHINDKGLKIIEVSEAAHYDKEHIPNALHTHISDWRYNNGTFLSIKDKKEIDALIGSLGLNKESNVVLYAPISTPKDLLKASYVFWALNYHGIKNVALLDGGLENWKRNGFAVTDKKQSAQKTKFNSKLDESKIADLAYVSKNIGKLPMLDARPSDKYLGINPTPTVKRDGHISGAMSYSWNYSLDNDYLLKPKKELEAIFKGYGLDKDQETIVYCTGGLETSYNYFVLSGVLGYKNIKLYDASMKEWGNKDDTKMTKYRYEMFK